MSAHETAAAIIAGGRSRRMGGGDKALLPFAGQPMIARIAAGVRGQVRALAISANGDHGRFAALCPGLPVFADAVPDQGPLAGVLAGLTWAAAQPGITCLLTVPTDTPLLPADLVARLAAVLGPDTGPDGAEIACARSAGRRHPIIALWRVSLAPPLAAWLAGGDRKVELFQTTRRLAVADIPVGAFDPCLNVNTPADLAAAEAVLSPS